MKIERQDLTTLEGQKDYTYRIEKLGFGQYPYLRALQDIDALVSFSYDALDRLQVRVRCGGLMICPCAVTLEDVEVPFQIDEEALVTYVEKNDSEDEETYCLMEESEDIEDLLLSFILPEVPIKVVKKGEIEYPSGDGWKVMTEAEFEESRRQRRDPRWDALRDLQIDKEEQ